VTKTPNGRYLSTSFDGDNAVEYSLVATPVREQTIPERPPVRK
jgi:hypothetical protein